MTQKHAPSVGLPMQFMVYALFCFGAGVIWLMNEPEILTAYHYRPHTVAVAHLFILGFILSVVMGSVYQLVPVALETRLYSERLVRWHAACHLIGVTIMVWMFYGWKIEEVGHAGSLVYLGMLLFVYNIARTLGRVERPNVVSAFIVAAIFWLFMTMTAGLLIAANKFWPILPPNPIGLMHAHAHMGLIGIFVMLIVGVSLKLIPMFALSELQSEPRAWTALILMNAGLAWLVSAIVANYPGMELICAGLIVAGLAVYGVELRAILKARKRRVLDWGLIYFITAVVLLVPAATSGLLGLWWSDDPTEWTMQWESVYALLGIFGVVILAILGMLYKIVPFMVWFHRYSPQIGRGDIPALADLYSPRLQAAGYWSYLMALPILCCGSLWSVTWLVQIGAMLLTLSAGLFLTNMGLILRHWIAPLEAKPLPKPATASIHL